MQPWPTNGLDNIMAYIIDESTESFYAYRDGAAMMALAVYIRTGDPKRQDALRALNRIFDRASIIKMHGDNGAIRTPPAMTHQPLN